MKYIAMLAVLTLFLSCGQQKISQLENEMAQLKKQNELIREQSESKDRFVEEYTSTLNEVYDNLENIRKREGLITEYSKNLEKNKKGALRKKMLSNIESIDNYIHKSRSRLSALEARYKEADLASKTFKETIDKLTRQLEEKETFIASLKTDIDSLNNKVTKASMAIRERDMIIDEQTDKINMAYYVIGTDDELEEKNIITEKGGLLGFGKTTVVASKLNNNDFNSTDITQTSEININQNRDDIEIISAHAPESYELVRENENLTKLEIKDPTEFWKMRYLVIVTKG